MLPSRYNPRPADPSDPEDLKAVEVRLNELFKPARIPSTERIEDPPLAARPKRSPEEQPYYCKHCDRKLTPEFAYASSNPKSKEGSCKRPDCKAHRKAIDPLLLNPDIGTEDTDVEAASEGDAVTDARQIVGDFLAPRKEEELDIQEQTEEKKKSEDELEKEAAAEAEQRAQEKEPAILNPRPHKLSDDYSDIVEEMKSDQERAQELMTRPELAPQNQPLPIWHPDRCRRDGPLRAERKLFGLSPLVSAPTPEIEIIKREADELVKARLEKEEKARRKRIEERRARLRNVLKKPNHTPRGIYGLSTRQTAQLLDKLEHCPLTREEAAFYRDYAAGNITKQKLLAKHGEWPKKDIYVIEARIINRAVEYGLLESFVVGESGVVDDDDDYKEERDLIENTGGATIGGRIHGGRLDGRYRELESFETAPTHMGRGNGQKANNRGPEHDDFGDESRA